jgi:uncharacterized protein YndB with AHSA1/START domain/nitroimidazol reductase NimA-like FMN-containing flavoprotein (pyridoxamine 5'-phosphate oxidase superfamily)
MNAAAGSGKGAAAGSAQGAVRLSRTLPAPPAEVYRAFLDPDRLRLWFGPADVRVLDVEVDARPGGTHRTALIGPDGSRGTIVCRLCELVPDERIVMTWSWVADDGRYGPQESLLTVELRQAGPDSTELTLVHSGLGGFPDEDPAGIRAAWEQAVAKLAATLDAGMTDREPRGVLDPRYSAADATATSWAQARQRLADAELYWLTTIRPDGGPHVTPLIAVWLDGAMHVCTGPHEQKARNLAASPRCALITGTNTLSDGYDLVIEGQARQVTDDAELARIADAYAVKYGSAWRFTVRDGHLHGAGGPAITYRVEPVTAYGFGKTTPSQTRWTFA